MIVGRSSLTSLTAAAGLCLLAAGSALAQRGKAPAAPEFTKQGLLITNFQTVPTLDKKLSRRAADAVRSRVYKLSNKKEVLVIDGADVDIALERSSYDIEGPLGMDIIRTLGRQFRADEYLLGTASNAGGVFHLRAELVLYRDHRLRQPIAEVSAPKLDDAAELLAQAIVAARGQMVPQRRCENALQGNHNEAAVAAAREGVATYSRSTIARTCLLWGLRGVGAPAAEVLAVARDVLALDATSVHALESGAISLDRLSRPAEAADLWLRLARTDTANLELASKIASTLVEGGSAKRAESWIVGVSNAHREHLPLLQQKWRATYLNKSWPLAIEAGEALLIADSTARADSTFHLRLASAYSAVGKRYKALETLARAVSSFPGDPRLYSLYTQTIRAESDSVVPRGLALFPNSADLLALNARDLRARGKLQESLDATRRAITIDTTMAQAQLMIAQLETELGHPDSALATLHKAITRGEDSALVAAFALSRGNALYKAANGTRTSVDFTLALRYLTFSDSVRPSTQSRFLVGAAALGVAQSALTEATKGTDKAESCRLAKLGAEMVPMARAGLEAGQEVLPEAAKQSLEYLVTLDPFVTQQLAAYCGAPGSNR